VQLFVLSIIPIAAFVVLIVLIAKTMGNSTRLDNAEWELKKLPTLLRRVDELERELLELKTPGIFEKKEQAKPKVESVSKELAFPQAVSATPATPIIQPGMFQAEQPRPSRTREEWESLIGGKLLNRIGALALTIALGLFLKYAFDNNWISETVRVLIGAAIGFVCLAGGYRTNSRGFQIFAQGLVGAGIAILYLSVYASFNFYQLVPQWLAFVLMSIVTIIAFAHGLYYDSLAEAILGWAGGFLTPILLSTGTANEVGLFSYIALLAAGLIALAIKKEKWYVLEPLTLGATWLMYQMWRDPYYTDADLWVTVFFITLFWALFLVLDVVRSRSSKSGEPLNQIVPGLNSLFYFLALYFILNKDHHAWMGLATVVIGLVYAVILMERLRSGDLNDQVKARYGLTAVALAVIATAIQFSDFDTVMFWSVEAAALMWLGRQWKLRHIVISSVVLFGLAVFKLIFVTDIALSYAPIADFVVILNHRAAGFAVAIVCLGAAGFMLGGTEEKRQRDFANALHYAWGILLFLLLTAETNDLFRLKQIGQPEDVLAQLSYFKLMTFSIVWIAYSVPLVWMGLRKRLLPLTILGLVIAVLAVVFGAVRGIAYDPIESFSPVLNVRSLALCILAVALVLQTGLIQKSRDAFVWLVDILGYVKVAIIVLVFVLLTGETRDFFQKDIVATTRPAIHQEGAPSSEEAVSRLSNLQQMSLSGVWLLYSGVLMGLGLWRKNREMRVAAIALFGFSILKIFIYDLSFLETLYRIFSFLALGLILLAVSYAYQKYRDVILGKA
jgi:uncharacterized membrane protein